MVRILIADDDPNIRDFLRRAMQRKVAAAQVETAGDGIEALTKLKATLFNLAIIEMYMPRMTGLEVLRAVRRKSLSTKIILLTGMATEELARKALSSGVQDFQEKPVILHGLINAVHGLLEKSRSQPTLLGKEAGIRAIGPPDRSSEKKPRIL